MTPGEVASHLRVSAASVRRMAASYEGVFGPLPRSRGQDGPRLWPVDAVRRVQVAHDALNTGKVTSLERALELVRDGADLPQRVTLPAEGDALVELLAEVRALRALAEAQGRELAALREIVAGRELPAPTAQAPLTPEPVDVGNAVQDAVKVALDPERLRVALHATERPRRGLLARLLGR